MLALPRGQDLIGLRAIHTVKQTVYGSICTHYISLWLELLGERVISHLHNTCVCQRVVSLMLDATELVVCDCENDCVHLRERCTLLLSTCKGLCVLVTSLHLVVVNLAAWLHCHYRRVVLGEQWLIIGILTHICLAITAELEYLLAERFEEVLVVQLGRHL